MQAVVHTKYGPPEVLRLREVKKPIVKDNEVLIKIRAATVNTGDCELRRFQVHILFWLFLRIKMGIIKPKQDTILGQEVAGEIEAVGSKVTEFKKGDQVIAQTGFVFGAYAEYVCLPTKYAIAIKPNNLSWQEAAAVPVGGANALHFMRRANIKPGQTVLIYGSSGSIGTMAIQLAKYYGAEVTAVCSTAKVALVKSLGATHVIDYTQEDFSKSGQRYDVVFETIGKCPFSKCLKVLKDKGTLLIANPKLVEMFRAIWVSNASEKKVMFAFADHTSEDLLILKALIEEKKLKTIIDDNRFTLAQTAEAHRYVEKGHKTGNVVITV
ncbi:MAG: NAD(P)-dependent alcohol dehydrogenase [Thiohalomonadales bacterium]